MYKRQVVPTFESLSALTLSMSGTPPPPAGTAPDGFSQPPFSAPDSEAPRPLPSERSPLSAGREQSTSKLFCFGPAGTVHTSW